LSQLSNSRDSSESNAILFHFIIEHVSNQNTKANITDSQNERQCHRGSLSCFHDSQKLLPPFITHSRPLRAATLHILIRRLRRTPRLLTSPHTNRRHRTNEKQNAKRDAKTPNRLHLITSRLGSADPDPVIGNLHVVLHRLDEVGGAAGVGEFLAGQVGDGHPGFNGDYD
jgi:hypothetical protein